MNGKYLADTNVIIKFLNGDEHSKELFNQAERVYVPAVVTGELFFGAWNSTRKQENMLNFTNFISRHEVVEIDLAIAETYGEIKARLKKDGINIPENDLWIAATAIARQYTLITYDGHFSKIVGLEIIG
jgi:tRNA(fMet)-specific endonuclease VapC